MDQNSILFQLSAIVQALAAVMAIVGTFMIFVYSLKWGRPPSGKIRRIWLGSTFGLASLLMVTITLALRLMPHITASASLTPYAFQITSVQRLAIASFSVLLAYIVLVQLVMRPKILSVDLGITNFRYYEITGGLEGEFLLSNPGTDLARDVKLFVRLEQKGKPVDAKFWDFELLTKGSPYIEEGVKKYRTENGYEFFRGDLHAGDSDPCSFAVKGIHERGNYSIILFAVDAYGFKSGELKYAWRHSKVPPPTPTVGWDGEV